MAVTENGQWELDGLLVGRRTRYPVDGVTGLGVPDMRTQDTPMAGIDGGYAGEDLLEPREVELTIGIDGDDGTSDGYGTLISTLAAKLRPRSSDMVATFRRNGATRRLYCRPRGVELPWDDDYHTGVAQARVRLYSADPRVYAETQSSQALSGNGTITTLGNMATYPILTITSPGSVVIMTNLADNANTLILDGAAGTVTVDFQNRTVGFGTLSYYSTVRPGSRWWSLQPGANSLQLSGAASFGFVWRDAYLTG